MHFSLKTLFLVSTWFAWLLGALIGAHPLVIESFILFQYLLVAISIAFALLHKGRGRSFATSYAVGFILWLLFLFVETQLTEMRSYRYSVPGSRIEVLAGWISQVDSFSNQQQKLLHYKYILSALHAMFGTIFGLLTYVGFLVVCCSTLRASEEIPIPEE